MISNRTLRIASLVFVVGLPVLFLSGCSDDDQPDPVSEAVSSGSSEDQAASEADPEPTTQAVAVEDAPDGGSKDDASTSAAAKPDDSKTVGELADAGKGNGTTSVAPAPPSSAGGSGTGSDIASALGLGASNRGKDAKAPPDTTSAPAVAPGSPGASGMALAAAPAASGTETCAPNPSGKSSAYWVQVDSVTVLDQPSDQGHQIGTMAYGERLEVVGKSGTYAQIGPGRYVVLSYLTDRKAHFYRKKHLAH